MDLEREDEERERCGRRMGQEEGPRPFTQPGANGMGQHPSTCALQ